MIFSKVYTPIGHLFNCCCSMIHRFLIVLQRNKIVSDNPSRETYFILKRLTSKNDVYSKESRHTAILQ